MSFSRILNSLFMAVGFTWAVLAQANDAIPIRVAYPQALNGQIPLVLDAARMVLAAGALSDAQVDALQVNWAQTVGFSLVPLVPDLMAFKLCGVNVRDWSPGSFSPERDDEEVSHDPGLD